MLNGLKCSSFPTFGGETFSKTIVKEVTFLFKLGKIVCLFVCYAVTSTDSSSSELLSVAMSAIDQRDRACRFGACDWSIGCFACSALGM